MVMHFHSVGSVFVNLCCYGQNQVSYVRMYTTLWPLSEKNRFGTLRKPFDFNVSDEKLWVSPAVKYFRRESGKQLTIVNLGEQKLIQKTRKKEHHLWHKRDSAGSGQKALNLVKLISSLPHEKDALYSALDKWIAWETEFPLLAAAKALKILRKRNQWDRAIQFAKWMLSKGQGATMATYDCLILAFDMDRRADEAEMLWNMILNVHNRSIPRRLFSRMISLYDHHNMPNMIVEVFADMEELGVKPDEDTVRRIARAFKALGLEDKQRLVMEKYGSKWKFIHFKGERIRVRRHPPE